MLPFSRVVQGLDLHTHERVLAHLPCKTNGFVMATHIVQKHRPLLGLIDTGLIPVQEAYQQPALLEGYLILTSTRILFYSTDSRVAPSPILLYEVYHSHIVDTFASRKGEEQLHIDSEVGETPSTHFFFGKGLIQFEKIIHQWLSYEKRVHFQREHRRCRKCGNMFPADAHFCPHCGWKINGPYATRAR